LGAVLGWCVAAIAFLYRIDDVIGFLAALAVMTLAALYGGRGQLQDSLRIISPIFVGGLLLAYLTPTVSGRTADRVEPLASGYAAGPFSHVPWGLTGAWFALLLMIGMARPRRSGPNRDARELGENPDSGDTAGAVTPRGDVTKPPTRDQATFP
jgi:hypothetical protein